MMVTAFLAFLHVKGLVLLILIVPSFQFTSSASTKTSRVCHQALPERVSSIELRQVNKSDSNRKTSCLRSSLIIQGEEYEEESSMSNKNTMPAFKSSIILTAAASEIAMAAADAEAMKHGWEVTICICDAGGVPIQVKRNSFPASYSIAVEKAKTAALFGKETGVLEDAVNIVEGRGSSRSSLLSAPYVLMRGGVPFIVDGVICGAIGVSGVKPDQDEQVAKTGIAALIDLF